MTIVDLDETQMADVVESVWLSTIGLTITPAATFAPPDEASDKFMFGRVHISGAYTGVVTITCPQALARQAMSIMCDVDQDTLTESEVRDALGELTNMIGGNVKSLLPGPSSLSLPEVAHGFDPGTNTPGSSAVHQVGFDCLGELLLVTLADL